MTRDEIINTALLRLRDANAIVFTCTYMCNAVNAAYADVMAASPYWPFLEQESQTSPFIVTAGTNSLTLPTDVFRVRTVMNVTDNLRLHEITGDNMWADLYPDLSNAVGQARHYRILNNKLYLYPYPDEDTTLLVDYFVQPGRLAAGTDVPVIPYQFHDMLVEYAMYLAYLDDGNPQLAAVHKAAYDAKLVALKAELLGPRGDQYAQINDNLF